MAYLEELLPEFRKGAKIRLSHWKKGKFILLKKGVIVNNDNYEYPLSILETLSNCWEFYKEPELDWDYIIKNKCLCLFWNDDETDIDILKYKYTDGFLTDCGKIWENCRPICKDEVTFYEDKKDEI